MAKTLDQAAGARDADLLGTWHLQSWVIDYDDGRPSSHHFGADVSGLLIYAPDGHMSAAIARGGRARLSDDNVSHATEPEKAAAFDGYLHYAGTWRREGGQVVHQVSLALNPNLVGTAQIRGVDLQGDRLVLSAAIATASGAGMINRLLWYRAPR